MNTNIEIKKLSLDDNLSINYFLEKDFFDLKFNELLIHQVIAIYIYNKYIRTKAQKNRGQVSGSNVKPWKQKGTGRARAGSKRSPLWRGGGRVFAYQGLESNYNFKKINKKMYRKAIRIIISELIRQNRLFLLCDSVFNFVKTKEFLNYINKFGIDKVLIIVNEFNKNIYLSTRNLHNIKVVTIKQINPIDLIKYKHILISNNSIDLLKERLS